MIRRRHLKRRIRRFFCSRLAVSRRLGLSIGCWALGVQRWAFAPIPCGILPHSCYTFVPVVNDSPSTPNSALAKPDSNLISPPGPTDPTPDASPANASPARTSPDRADLRPENINDAVIRLAGNSQDGIQSAGAFLARLAGRSDQDVMTYMTIPATISGGPSIFQVRMGTGEVL